MSKAKAPRRVQKAARPTREGECYVCHGTREVAYISLPKGQRIRPCPRCSGGVVPAHIKRRARAGTE